MARIRTIKPEFWVDEKIVEVSFPARLLFIGLWNFSDDYGRMEFREKKIKMQIFPADSLQITPLFEELEREELIERYVVDDNEYLQVKGFSKHQKIDSRAVEKIPPNPNSPPDFRGNDLGGEKEGKGKGREGINGKHAIPADFCLTDNLIAYAATKGIQDKKVLEGFTESFVLSCKSKKYKYADFDSTWKNWLRKDIDEGKIKPEPVRSTENF